MNFREPNASTNQQEKEMCVKKRITVLTASLKENTSKQKATRGTRKARQ